MTPQGPTARATRDRAGAGRSVLVTGAGGSIGAGLCRALWAMEPRPLVLLEASEQGLYEIGSELSTSPPSRAPVAVLGDVCDESLLAELFEAHRPEIVYHAAAFKHVPLMERHAVAAARNNALATGRLVRVAAAFGAEQVLMISTDKAVEPTSVMGATKNVAELALRAAERPGCVMKAIRLGNVLESRGSVAPLFRRQIAARAALTVAHPEAERYFLALDEAVDLILRLARLDGPGGTFVPVLGPPRRVLDLARDLLREAGRAPEGAVVFTGLRPGDKMSERLVAASERACPTSDERLLRVDGPPVQGGFAQLLASLADAVERRDGVAVLEALQEMVPEYRPSPAALEALGRRPVAERR